MTDPQAWLEDRLADAPAALRDRVRAGISDLASDNARVAYGVQRAADPVSSPASDSPDIARFATYLRDRADALLAEACSGGPGHDTALTLLAADALVTLACEWVAEHAPDRLGELR